MQAVSCARVEFHQNGVISSRPPALIRVLTLRVGDRGRKPLGVYPITMEANKDMVTIESILWQGFVLPGHEACRLYSQDSRWHLEGTAVFSHEKQPCRLDYQVICDEAWRTLSAEVNGWLGTTIVD